jgi:CheY-like chemotaxis protein
VSPGPGGRGVPSRPVQHGKLRHDLRTPLNAVIGYSEMLLEDQDQSDLLGEQLRHLRAQAMRLSSKVESADVGRLESELGRPAATLLRRAERLRDCAAAEGLPEITPDLDRIVLATRRFQALLADLGAPEPGSPSPRGAVRADRAPTAYTGPGTLLVVEDSELNRDVLTRRLERQGHAVTAVANGREALDMLRAQRFDLVLLDIGLPEMDGYEVLGRLKADTALRDLPVIVISALDEIESVVRCIEMGAEDFLSKPFNPTLLSARVGACLEKKRLRDQEIAYLQSVAQVAQAAAAVEAGRFDPQALDGVGARSDALGQLARVFQRMAREVRAREERLTQQVQELRIQVDEAKKARAVAEITTTDYFQNLQMRAQELRNRRDA